MQEDIDNEEHMYDEHPTATKVLKNCKIMAKFRELEIDEQFNDMEDMFDNY